MGVMREAASRYLGRYEVLEYLGSGGMSDVYVALHMGLRKKVALKVLRSTLRDDDEAIERFLREGECAARVSHPNIVGVHDVGIEEGVPYLVMELLSGETLDKRLAREGTLSLEVAVDLLLPICDAIDHVHRAGVIHRDVKPSNILLAQREDGNVTPKLVDFGVATLRERRLITGALGPIGTPTYMSPEQARGLDPVDGSSDQYSLASVLFELLTGREPYPGADIDSVLASVARGQFPRLSELLRHVPRSLDDVLARATAYHPRDRFASVREFADALLPFASRRVRDSFRAHQAPAVPDEHSGARLSLGFDTPLTIGGARDSQATVRMRPSFVHAQAAQTRAAQEGPRQRRMLMGTVGALALALGLAVGITQLRSQPPVASAQIPGALPGVGKTSQAPLHTAPLSAHAQQARLSVYPAHALSVLDGEVLGQGDVSVPHAHGEGLHELRISAPGYVTRVLLFRGAPAEDSIALTREP